MSVNTSSFSVNYSTGKDEFCYRCFRMKVRSYNVLQLHTTTLNKCFMREDMATASCPTKSEISAKHVKELILFRKSFLDLFFCLFCKNNNT